MTLIAGIIIGALAMWLREWVLAKPSPLLKLPASELRAMLERTNAGAREAHSRWIEHQLADRHGSANGARDTYHRLLDEAAALRDALRIVEARSVEVKAPQQGVYR